MSEQWTTWLAASRARREAAGLQRTLRPRSAAEGLVDLAGNDYLGLSRHPTITAAAAEAARVWGAGAAASRLVTGTTQLHADLERSLADFTGMPAALCFSTGYHANLSVLAALADRDSLLVSDSHVHASLIDGARLSRASVLVTPHNDVDAVAASLSSRKGRRALVLVESVYSVFGDAAPLADLLEVCERHDALLVVDEAHGLGVRGEGRGLLQELGLTAHPSLVMTCTLSKSLGAQGGGVLGPPELIDHLVNAARPFIFDTGLAPASAGAALAALQLIETETDRVERGTKRAHELATALDIEVPDGWVMSVPMTSPAVALTAQQAARERGVAVGCFRPPSVPDGISRLRMTINAGVPEDQWRRAVDVLVDVVAAHR
ncbi:8-amino-7-oxononanoate synthase [Nocardioides sp.]|uniref:8-amino-7-oxononanoate synthase n=1 Tax=Nocardioides sp. TaxID=35761 RepID=UPI003D123011